MSSDIIVNLVDWEGDNYSFQILRSMTIGTTFCAFAKNHDVPLEALQFIYNDRILPTDCNATAEELGLDHSDEILVQVVDSDKIPSNNPITIKFDDDEGGIISVARIKPNWDISRICMEFSNEANIVLNTLQFLYRGTVIFPKGYVGNVRQLGIEDGDTIHVTEKVFISPVNDSNPLSFVRLRQRVATPFVGTITEGRKDIGGAPHFGTVVDYVRSTKHWIVEYDGGDRDNFTKQDLGNAIHHYKTTKEKDDIPHIIGPNERGVSHSSSSYHNADFDNFLFGEIASTSETGISIELVQDFWSKRNKEYHLNEEEFHMAYCHSIQSTWHYLEETETQSNEQMIALLKAHFWTSLMIGEVLLKKRNLNDVVDVFQNARGLYEAAFESESMADNLITMRRIMEQEFRSSSSTCANTPSKDKKKIKLCFKDTKNLAITEIGNIGNCQSLSIVFSSYANRHWIPLEKLSFMHDCWKLAGDLTLSPSQLGIKNDTVISVFRKHEIGPLNFKLAKFLKTEENATYRLGGASTHLAEGVEIVGSIIDLIDTITYKAVRFQCGESTVLKQLFKAYSKHLDVNLRELSFAYKGEVIFPSSIQKKTPQQIGMDYYDVIIVSLKIDTSSDGHEENSKPQSSIINEPKKRNKKSSRKKASQPISVETEEERLRRGHSKAISRVFEEADPWFRKIKQQLTAMNLKRTKPKQRENKSKDETRIMGIASNPSIHGSGGKAGKSEFIVHVGEATNLYTTTKTRRDISNIKLDLHGLSREEALETLDESLPGWIDIAMKGSHPWVIRVKIVCGGGNQILAETVKNWIGRNVNVSNAPTNRQC